MIINTSCRSNSISFGLFINYSVVIQAAPGFLSSIAVNSWSRTLEGNFGVGLTLPTPFPGLGGISNFIFKRTKLRKLLCSQYMTVVSTIDFVIKSGSHVMSSGHFRECILHLTVSWGLREAF